MILVVAFGVLGIAAGIGIALFYLGRLLIRKGKETSSKILYVIAVVLCMVFAVISIAAIGGSVYFLYEMVRFVSEFPL